MIKNIYSNSKHIVATGGNTGGPYFDMSQNSLCGQVRWNPMSQVLEIYNGCSWYSMNSSASLGLTHDAEAAINWAINKQQEERELEELCKKHPGLNEAHEAFKIMLALTKTENKDQV